MKTIGIVMRIENFDGAYKWFVNKTYIQGLEALNVALFPICSYASLHKAIEICDGLIIPGGYDLHAYYLNENQNQHATTYELTMDHFDFQCIDAFYRADKAILGICRGMQLLNVFFKGTLYQHIAEDAHANQHCHEIHFIENSFLYQLYPNTIKTNSFHHQAVAILGKGLKSSAVAEDQIIEAFEHENKKIIGVQWHPERLENDQVLSYFIDVLCD